MSLLDERRQDLEGENPGWEGWSPVHRKGGDEMTDDDSVLATLRRAHPDFVIGFTRVFDGQRISAHRTDADAGGLYAVIGTPQEVETELAREQRTERRSA